MTDTPGHIEKHVRLSAALAERLRQLAERRQISEDAVVERALEILFSLTQLLDDQAERRDWSFLSEDSLRRVWDNDQDSAYDDWRTLYGVPAG